MEGALLYERDHYNPVVTSVSGAPSTWVDSVQLSETAAGSDQGMGMFEFAWVQPDSTQKTSTRTDCTGAYGSRCSATWSATFNYFTGPLPEGVDRFAAAARDVVSNGSPESPWYVKVDHLPPHQDSITGSLRVPDGTWIPGGTNDLTVNASDPNSGVQSDQITLGPLSNTKTNTQANGSPCDANGCTTTINHPWSVSTSSLADGAYQVGVTTKDPLGHPANATPWTVKIDSHAPALTGTPTGTLWDNNNKAIDSGAYDIHATATDPAPGSGIQDIKVLVNGIEEDASHATQTCSQTCPASMPRDFTFNTAGRAQGRYRIQLIAHDKVNHPTTLADVTVTLDTTPPDIALSGSLWDARGTQLAPGTYTLHVHATDGDATAAGARSGVQTVEIFVDGESVDVFTQSCPQGSCDATRDWTFNTADYDGGAHNIHVEASDQQDHSQQTSPFTVTNACCIQTASSWGTFPQATYDVAYGDVNGDSQDDVVARNKLTGDVQVGLSTGTTFSSSSSWGTFSPLNDLHLADVDGDGSLDLVGRNAAGQVSVELSTGSSFQSPTVWGTLAANYEMQVVDMDQDGMADLAGRDRTTGDFVVGWSNQTSFDPVFSWGTFNPAYQLTLADVDGDGAADLVGINPATGDVLVSISNGGNLGPATSWGTVANADTTVADGNGDGMADLIVRDRDSDGVSLLPSTGTSFDAAQPWGSFNSLYDFGSADLDGDGNADVVGRQVATGDVRVGLTNAPYPQNAPLADDTYTPTPPDIGIEPPPTDTSGGAAVQAAAAHKPALAFEDDDRLLTRERLIGANPDQPTSTDPDPFGAGEPTAIQRINHIYDRLHEVSGDGGVIRFDVWWGLTENAPDASNPSGYRGGTRWYLDKLDRAIRLARAKGFKIELTLSGGNGACNGLYNLDSLNCTTGGQMTDVNPDPTRYAQFVRALVDHYTRDATGAPLAANDPLRVHYFSLWNEPNNSNFLSTGTNGVLPTQLYHDLASSGASAYYSAINVQTPAPVKGTSLAIGELASAEVSGYDPGDPSCQPTAKKKKCMHIGPSQFLARASRGGLVADAVALHPYQYRDAPWLKGRGAQHGIGRLGEFLHGLDALCNWGPSGAPASAKSCLGDLRTPNFKRPRLLLTEFGYFNRPLGRKAAQFDNAHKPAPNGPRKLLAWHTEKQRALWLGGGLSGGQRRHGAMQQVLDADARSSFSIDMMLLYTATEVQPNETIRGKTPNNDWDTGLLGRPGIDWDPATKPDGDINGVRSYGVSGKQPGANHPQMRRAYCAVHKWAAQNGYVPLHNNHCP
jgi:hypothetical protein